MKVLSESARHLGLRLNEEHLRAFEIYYRELVAWNKKFNLTAITDYDQVQIKHFLDSLTRLLADEGLTRAICQQPGVRVIDVGAGAGFPGLPLKIVCPGLQLTLLEATGKKVGFLEHMVGRLGLAGVEVIRGRAEELGRDAAYRERYDLALARAVAELSVLVEYALPFCRLGDLFITPGEAIAQEMAARMGAVTGKGLSGLIREEFGVRITFFTMLGLLAANLGTVMAEFVGIAAGLELFGISKYISVPVAALLVWWLVARGSYSTVEKTLLALCAALFAYIVSGFIVRPPWGQVLQGTLIPSLRTDINYILLLIAAFGTTLAPWMQFYLQSSVTEKGITLRDYSYTRLEVFVGAIFSNLVSWFIIVTTAATLFVHGISVESAADAAHALAPLAGEYAGALFAMGLVGASTLAAAVLPISTAYAVCEAFGRERGIHCDFEEAPLFYGLYTGTIVIGAAAILLPGIPLVPVMMLSQVVNGILLPVIMLLMIKLANSQRIMGNHVNGRLSNAIAKFTAIFVALTTAVLLASWLF